MTKDHKNEILAAIQGLDNKFQKLEFRFDKIDARFNWLETQLNSLGGRTIGLEEKMDRVIMKLVEHDERFDKLCTKEAFQKFKDEALSHFDTLIKNQECLDMEQASLSARMTH